MRLRGCLRAGGAWSRSARVRADRQASCGRNSGETWGWWRGTSPLLRQCGDRGIPRGTKVSPEERTTPHMAARTCFATRAVARRSIGPRLTAPLADLAILAGAARCSSSGALASVLLGQAASSVAVVSAASARAVANVWYHIRCVFCALQYGGGGGAHEGREGGWAREGGCSTRWVSRSERGPVRQCTRTYPYLGDSVVDTYKEDQVSRLKAQSSARHSLCHSARHANALLLRGFSMPRAHGCGSSGRCTTRPRWLT